VGPTNQMPQHAERIVTPTPVGVPTLSTNTALPRPHWLGHKAIVSANPASGTPVWPKASATDAPSSSSRMLVREDLSLPQSCRDVAPRAAFGDSYPVGRHYRCVPSVSAVPCVLKRPPPPRACARRQRGGWPRWVNSWRAGAASSCGQHAQRRQRDLGRGVFTGPPMVGTPEFADLFPRSAQLEG
jgi:hypothetical protein